MPTDVFWMFVRPTFTCLSIIRLCMFFNTVHTTHAVDYTLKSILPHHTDVNATVKTYLNVSCRRIMRHVLTFNNDRYSTLSITQHSTYWPLTLLLLVDKKIHNPYWASDYLHNSYNVSSYKNRSVVSITTSAVQSLQCIGLVRTITNGDCSLYDKTSELTGAANFAHYQSCATFV